MKSDLHMHPLSHKYYFNMIDGFSGVALDDEDRCNIRNVVDWCCYDRGLDTIALTDHDMIQASLYAEDYVAYSGVPIRIITGVECTVRDPLSYDQEVHLLCLGLYQLPKYTSRTPVDRMIQRVHDMGGTVIMSHPIIYPDSFYRYCHLLDGYEYRNSDKAPFDDGIEHLDSIGLNLRTYSNSDFHYEGALPTANAVHLHHNDFEFELAGRRKEG